jgi:hypothetical protein
MRSVDITNKKKKKETKDREKLVAEAWLLAQIAFLIYKTIVPLLIQYLYMFRAIVTFISTNSG